MHTVLMNQSPPLISSHSLNILIFHITPPFRSVLTFFLLEYSSSISFIHSVHSYLHVFEFMVDTFHPLQHRLHISTPLHFPDFPPSLFFYNMHLSLFFFYLNCKNFYVIQKCLTSWSTLVLLFIIWFQLYFRDLSIFLATLSAGPLCQ